ELRRDSRAVSRRTTPPRVHLVAEIGSCHLGRHILHWSDSNECAIDVSSIETGGRDSYEAIAIGRDSGDIFGPLRSSGDFTAPVVGTGQAGGTATLINLSYGRSASTRSQHNLGHLRADRVVLVGRQRHGRQNTDDR